MASLRHRKHCFPFTCLSFMFYLLFSLHSITIDDDDAAISFVQMKDAVAPSLSKERSIRSLLLHCFSNGTDDWTRAWLAAASFFERTDPSRALIVCRNDSLLLLLPHSFPIVVDSYACCCILLRTGDRSDAGLCLRLLQHSFFERQRLISLFYLRKLQICRPFYRSLFSCSFSLLLHL